MSDAVGDWQADRSDLRSSGGTGDIGAATGMAILGCVRYVVLRLRPFEKTCMRKRDCQAPLISIIREKAKRPEKARKEAKNVTWALVGLTMSICGLRMTNPAEEALDIGVPTADEDDRSVWGESANGEKNPDG